MGREVKSSIPRLTPKYNVMHHLAGLQHWQCWGSHQGPGEASDEPCLIPLFFPIKNRAKDTQPICQQILLIPPLEHIYIQSVPTARTATLI